MAMVSADGSSQSFGGLSPNRLVWSEGWRPPCAQSAFIKWTGWTLAMTMSWWQHHKHCRGYYYYYYYYSLSGWTRVSRWNCEIPWQRVPYLNTLYVCSRRGAIYKFTFTFPLPIHEKNDWWGMSPSTWNFGSNWPRWSEIADFRSFFAHSDSAVTPSEKGSINTNRKSTMRFPMSPRWTSYVVSK